MTRPSTILLILGLVLATLAGMWVSRAMLHRDSPAVQHGTLLVPPQPMPEFSLVAENGQPFSRQQLQGQWHLVFFGFTHCPDVCPTTLAKLADVRKRLADLPAASQPRVILVSVDPERDTPAVMAEYLRAFDPSFRGLTGQPRDVDAFAASLGVAHRKIFMGGDQYMVDHTAVVMLLDPEARRTAIFSPPLEAENIASDLRLIMAGNGRG